MNIIDLSFSVEEGMPCFSSAWHIPFSYEILGTIDTVGRNTRKLIMGSHTGTHMDAPKHFINGGASIDEVELSKTCGKVSIIDLHLLNEGEAVTRNILSKYNITERVLFIFGWTDKWMTNQYYQNYPYFTEDAAKYLIECGVIFIAMDTPSPDDSRTKLLSKEDSTIHKLLLGNGVILVEYLANTEKINPAKDYYIFAMPMKIKGSDGAPARVILVENDSSL